MSRFSKYLFNRSELAGSLGDLGTILPLAIGMILVNGLDPAGLFFSLGILYIVSGVFYGVTVPVQPMKVIGAYAIATGISVQQINAAGLMMGGILLLVGLSGAINVIGKYVPKSVIRGVQLSTGILLLTKGVQLIFGTSSIQTAVDKYEPYLSFQVVGPVPLSIIIGVIGLVLTFVLLENKKFPAGLVVVGFGLLVGIVAGTGNGFDTLQPGVHLPQWMPFQWPSTLDFGLSFFALVLPQLPMTVGNAVIANVDLSRDYFKEKSRKVTYKNVCITMAVGNLISFVFGGMPMCHGAGGLAAHYRFGARTAGSNLMIGGILILLVLFFGKGILAICYLIPMAILGVLLVFAGTQ